MYEKVIDFYFESLSKSLKKRKDKQKKTNREVFPAEIGINLSEEIIESQQNTNNKRVSKILNNRRDKSYPYLMSDNEVNIMVGTLNYKCSDEMLWSHIDWKKMYKMIIKEVQKNNLSDSLREVFDRSLIDYIPYAELYYYENTSHGKGWNKYTEENKREIRTKAIQWCYLDYEDVYSKHLELKFKNYFKDSKLKKFDLKISEFLTEFLTDFFKKLEPQEDSFGHLVYEYQENLDIHRHRYNHLLEYFQDEEHKDELKEVRMLEKYLKYSKQHINELGLFQKEFKESGIDLLYKKEMIRYPN